MTGKLEIFLKGAAAASSPEPVPGIQQAGEEEELLEESAGDRQGFEQGRSASFSPQPSPEHPLQSSPQPSSESLELFGESPRYHPRKVQEATGRHLDHDAGASLTGMCNLPCQNFDAQFPSHVCLFQP